MYMTDISLFARSNVSGMLIRTSEKKNQSLCFHHLIAVQTHEKPERAHKKQTNRTRNLLRIVAAVFSGFWQHNLAVQF